MVGLYKFKFLVYKAGRHIVHAHRYKSGLQTGIVFSLVATTTFYSWGPHIQDSYIRYALAGTCATVLVEVLTHGFDTINMQSKVLNRPTHYVAQFFGIKGFLSLFRGLQAVVYGYFVSSMVYFYLYAKLKDRFKSWTTNQGES
jgi:hypothetical protein